MLDDLNLILNKFGSRTAYSVDGESISFQTLAERAFVFSELLRRQGSDPVILYGHKSIDMFVSIFSCVMAHRTYIPVDISVPSERIKRIIRLSGASLFIRNEEVEVEDIETCTLSELTRFAGEEKKECNAETAYVMFTSGSTGDPKGVPISRSNLENFIRWENTLTPLDTFREVRVMNQVNFNFDVSVADIYYSMGNGHTLFGLTKEKQNDMAAMMAYIKDNGINVIFATPTFIKMCLLSGDFDREHYPELKCVYLCGEILENRTAAKLLAAFPELGILDAYGPTEATSAVSATLVDRAMVEKYELLPVGVMENNATEICVIDDEIVLKGASVFSGYYGGIIGGYYNEDGVNCYRTGDVGYIEDGYLFCKGRMDNQIKFNGYRIELFEIENLLNNISYIKQCAVVAKKDPSGIVKMIKAYAVSDIEIDPAAVKEELGKSLPPYMIPKIIKQMDVLPTNANEKVDRKLLAQM